MFGSFTEPFNCNLTQIFSAGIEPTLNITHTASSVTLCETFYLFIFTTAKHFKQTKSATYRQHIKNKK